jgi:hypothetical protein
VIIQYKTFAELVTEEQAKAAEHYEKEYLTELMALKKKEWYFEGRLERVDCYLDNDEDVNAVTAQLAALNVNFEIVKREKVGDFTMTSGEFYKNNVLTQRFKELYDLDGEFIGREELNIVTGLPDIELTTKHIPSSYDENDDGFSSHTFSYHADGNFKCYEFDYSHDYDSENYELYDYQLVKDRFKLSEAWFDYYATAHLYPTGLIQD